jgi:hypothetical protein
VLIAAALVAAQLSQHVMAGHLASRAGGRRGGDRVRDRVVAAIVGAADPDDRTAVRTDIKRASSVSPAVSLPTKLMAFAGYSQDSSFAATGENHPFMVLDGRRVHRRAGGRQTAPAAVPTRYWCRPWQPSCSVASAIKVWRRQ